VTNLNSKYQILKTKQENRNNKEKKRKKKGNHRMGQNHHYWPIFLSSPRTAHSPSRVVTGRWPQCPNSHVARRARLALLMVDGTRLGLVW
jgi:hypothetical protein